MSFYQFVPLIASLTTLAMGLFVLYRDQSERLNRLFLAITVLLAFWGIGEFVMRVAGSEEIAFLGARIGAVGWCLVGPVFVLFALTVTEHPWPTGHPLSTAAIFLPGAFFLAATLSSDLVFEGFELVTGGYNEIAGPLRMPSKVCVLLYFIAGIAILAHFVVSTGSREKKVKAGYVLAATCIPVVLGFISDMLLPIMGSGVPVSSIAVTPLMCAIIAYAVTRHDLMTRVATSFGSTVISSITDAVIVTGTDGVIESANHAAQELTGYNESDLVGTPSNRLFAEPPPSLAGAGQTSADAGGSPGWSLLLGRDGRAVPVSRSTGEITRRDGRVIGTVIVLHDMRDAVRLMQAEREVKAAEARVMVERDRSEELKNLTLFLQGVLDNLPEPIFIKDRSHRIIYANEACGELEGRSTEEIVGTTGYEYYDAEVGKRTWEENERLFITGEQACFERTLLNSSVGHTAYKTIITPLMNDNGGVEYLLFIVSDLTEQKQVDKARLDFVRIAAHELRTPLTSLKLGFDLLARETRGSLDEEQQRSLDVLSLSIERISLLAKNLLDLASLEAGAMNLDRQPVALEVLIWETSAMFEPELEARSIACNIDCEDGLPTVLVDSVRVSQVLVNLLSNAGKFTKEGSITVSARCVEDGFVEVCVSDTGVGIPRLQQEHVFSRFAKVQSAERAQRGAGLGLTISRAVVEAHGGRMWLNSRVGKGSRFYFTLPVA